MLNDALQQRAMQPESLFEAFVQLAPDPDHPFNGEGLHENLVARPMSERDAGFGQVTYWAIESEGPWSRLAQWAAAGPYPTYDDATVELAAIPLIWLFSSPNRFVRDWLTKALVSLLRGHPEVLARLIHRFIAVDDPYVSERVITVAYGALLRAESNREPAFFQPIVEAVSNAVFAGGTPPANALLLDAAVAVMEWADRHGLISEESALERSRPPYGLPRPDNPWSMDRIDQDYGREVDLDERDHSAIYSSLFHMGDFGRYVMQGVIQPFTRVPRDEPVPDITRPGPKLVKSKFRAFVKSLTPEQLQVLGSVEDSPPRELDLLVHPRIDLSDEQHALLSDMWRHPKVDDYQYPEERAHRWVFMRVVKMGWTPERFGDFDESIQRSGGARVARKRERFGKKYQWIALWELVARINDNYHRRQRDYDTFVSEYLDLRQICDRDIDPSLPPIPFENFFGDDEDELPQDESRLVTEVQTLAGQDLSQTAELDGTAFVHDIGESPAPEDAMTHTDVDGTEWLILNAYASSAKPDGESEFGINSDQGYFLWTWLANEDTALRLGTEIIANGTGIDTIQEVGEASSEHNNCCYAGELSWRAYPCQDSPLDEHDKRFVSAPVVPTTQDYSWSGSDFDCSIKENVVLTMPSQGLTHLVDPRWDGKRAWYDDGQVVLRYERSTAFMGSHALLARRDWLLGVLETNSLRLLCRFWGERRDLTKQSSPWTYYNSAAVLGAAGDVLYSDAVSEAGRP